MRKPPRLAIIGAGAMAREHIKAFLDLPGVSVAGIWNRTSGRAEKLASEFGISVVADSIEELYARTRADLAIVAVYETAINAVMKQALAHPWAILMEKPVGLDLPDGEDIAAAARSNAAKSGAARSSAAKSSNVYVGLNRRFLSSTQAALADLDEDPHPRFIHVQDQQSLETARRIGHADIVVRNWMYANSIHLIDYFCAFGRGDVTEVTRVAPWRPENPGIVLAKIAFAGGDIGLYEGIWNGPGPWACTVTTPRRRWEMRPLERATYQNAGERTLNPVEAHRWDNEFKPGLRLQAQRVAAAVCGDEQAVTLDQGLRTMRLIDAIFAH
jgi:predicted dehydrogenase